MAGKIIGQHEISTIGKTTLLAFTNAAANVQLVSDFSTAPAMFLLATDQDVYLRQGPSSGADATTSDYLLKKGSTLKVTVLDENSAYISAVRSSTSGTLMCTLNNSKTPGSGVSG